MRLKEFVDHIPVAVWRTTADGMAEFFNQHHLDYVGRSHDDLEGLGFLSQFHPDDLPRLFSNWQNMMAANEGANTRAGCAGPW